MTEDVIPATVVGVFARREDAERALAGLRAAGFADDRVTFDADAELDVPDGERAVAVVVQTVGRDAEARAILGRAGAADVYDPVTRDAAGAGETVEDEIMEHLPPPIGELAPAAPPIMPPIPDDAPVRGSEEGVA